MLPRGALPRAAPCPSRQGARAERRAAACLAVACRIIKNSWGSGESWGDDGFGMIEMIGLDGKPSWGACSMYFWMLRPAEVLPRQGDPVPPAPKTRECLRCGGASPRGLHFWDTRADWLLRP